MVSKVEAYLDTVKRIEPDVHPLDHAGAIASIAISLKRIADAMQQPNAYGEVGGEAISGAILRGLQSR